MKISRQSHAARVKSLYFWDMLGGLRSGVKNDFLILEIFLIDSSLGAEEILLTNLFMWDSDLDKCYVVFDYKTDNLQHLIGFGG